jgi:hypothetical protein
MCVQRVLLLHSLHLKYYAAAPRKRWNKKSNYWVNGSDKQLQRL